jgi:hypothetical protein
MTNATKIPRELPESDVERQVIASDLSPPEFFRQEAEECLNKRAGVGSQACELVDAPSRELPLLAAHGKAST